MSEPPDYPAADDPADLAARRLHAAVALLSDALQPATVPIDPDAKDTAGKRTSSRDGTKAAKPTPSHGVALRRNGSRGRPPSAAHVEQRGTRSTWSAPPLYIH